MTNENHMRDVAQGCVMRAALEGIRVYTSDTLSGRADGPDDREWQREAVVEVNRRAREALAAQPPTAPVCSHPKARFWMERDGDTWLICPDCHSKWVKPPAAPVETDPLHDSRNPNHGRTGGLRDPVPTHSSAGNAAEAIRALVLVINPRADELDDRDANKLFDAARRMWAAGYRLTAAQPQAVKELDEIRAKMKRLDETQCMRSGQMDEALLYGLRSAVERYLAALSLPRPELGGK